MDDIDRYQRRLAVRRQSLRRVGVKNVRCICGETDPLCFEADHIYRREHDDACWGICVNCHRKRTARGETEHPPVGKRGNRLERVGHMLLGAADYQDFISAHLREASEVMFTLAGMGISVEE